MLKITDCSSSAHLNELPCPEQSVNYKMIKEKLLYDSFSKMCIK